MLKRTTTIKESPRKMDVASLMPESNIVMLSSVDGMEEFEKIIVNVKVLEVKEKKMLVVPSKGMLLWQMQVA